MSEMGLLRVSRIITITIILKEILTIYGKSIELINLSENRKA